MKRLITLCAVVAAGCLPLPPPPPVPTPPPTAQTVPIPVTILAPGRLPVPGLTCELRVDTLPAPLPCAYDGVSAIFQVPADVSNWGAALELHAPGFQGTSERLQLQPHLGERLLRPLPPFLSAGESGWLVRAGPVLAVEGHDEPWQWRYASSFDLARQFCAGLDISAAVADLVDVDQDGHPDANGVRVLGMMHWLTRFYPQDVPDYYGCIGQLADWLATRGLRLEFVVFADADYVLADKPAQQAHWARTLGALADKWNVSIELCNECSKNGINPDEWTKPVGSRTLFSHGSGTGDADPALPCWDYCTHHPARADEWPRRIECREYRDNGTSPARGWPCVEDEPMGAGDQTIAGRRSADAASFSQWGALCGMQALGCTFHSETGLFSQPLTSVQRAMAAAFYHGIKWVPTAAQTWAYQRGEANGGAGIGNMPMEHKDEWALRTFCKGDGQQEWCVVVRPTPAWRLIARPGWMVDSQPQPWLVHLRRAA